MGSEDSKNSDGGTVIEAVTVDDEKVAFEATDCPTCGKTYKREAAYLKHIKSCTGTEVTTKVERVKMTDEEKAEKIRAGSKAWTDKHETITVRLLKGGDDVAFVEAQLEALKEKDERAGMATYFKVLLAKAKKLAIKRGDWEKVEEA